MVAPSPPHSSPIAAAPSAQGWRLRVQGTVQGVGFRPWVYQWARALGLRGSVHNDGAGVVICIAGAPSLVAAFVGQLQPGSGEVGSGRDGEWGTWGVGEMGDLPPRPPLAHIERLEQQAISPDTVLLGPFTIRPSQGGPIRTHIAPDTATCPACLADTVDPHSRFYRYPFTNCTHCGPRLSLIHALPYDRPQTAMAAFPLCPTCRQQYADPRDRRFHAQPIACPRCGPQVALVQLSGPDPTLPADPIAAVQALLKRGEIVAIKGLGGIHLACDATNAAAIQRLRDRKPRPHKPLALMVRDVAAIAPYCHVSPEERALLESPAAPIVLLRRREWGVERWGGGEMGSGGAIRSLSGGYGGREGARERGSEGEGERGRGGARERGSRTARPPKPSGQAPPAYPSPQALRAGSAHPPTHPLSPSPPLPLSPSPLLSLPLPFSLSPALPTLGVMLPYTPLHHLILAGLDRPIVLTSGNRAGEPQCIDDAVAQATLGEISPYLLLHNRPIVNRVDDSVVRWVAGRRQTLRRARGYAPTPIALPPGFQPASPILALGAALKSTICLVQDGQAILSQHLGDLEQATAWRAYQDTVALYQRLFDHHPAAIAVDLHPDYLTRKWGQQLSAARGLPCYGVQHHHAHIAACLVEHGVPLDAAPVLGIVLDGLGYGADGGLWGGEFLVADYRDCQRVGHLDAIALLGGAQAMKQPWRNTYAHLMAVMDWATLVRDFGDLDLVQFLARQPRPLLDHMLTTGLRSPRASSAGRLFDAVAAAVGCCRDAVTYEGQGAMALEALVTGDDGEAYPFGCDRALGSGGNREMPVLFAQRLRRSNEVVGFAAPEGLGGRGGDRETPWVLSAGPMWRALLGDLQAGVEPGAIAARFHFGLANAIAHLAHRLTQTHDLNRVVLSGGVFQNAVLLETVGDRLTAAGLSVLTPQIVPPNDGGIALGQGAIAAARWLGRVRV